DVPEAADDRLSGHVLGGHVRIGPGRVRDAPEPAVVARRDRALGDVARVDDEPAARLGRVLEYLAREREVLRPHLPERRHDAVEDAVRQQPPRDTGLALHRAEVAGPVAPAERQARDEVVEDEVVEDDDAGTLPQRLDDPAVGVGVVADVVEAHVRAGGRRASVRDDVDVDAPPERREQELAVLGDPRPLRGKRREVRDLHASRRSTAWSHVTCSATALPARPKLRTSSGCSRRKRTAPASASPRGSQTRPVRRSATTSSGPPASVVVTTGFSDRNASYGTIPKSSSTGA